MFQEYFTKVKGQALQAIGTLAERVGVDIESIVAGHGSSTSTSSSNSSSNNGSSSSSANGRKKAPSEQLLDLFKSISITLDKLSDTEGSNTLLVGDKLLLKSNVKDSLKSIIAILEIESDKWLSSYNESPDPEISELPCLHCFLQHKMMIELCNRAINDSPKGLLPLIISSSASLLRRIRYPLLPHVTVHRPLEKLISTASRLRFHQNDSKQDVTAYKARVDIALVTLIRALWRKIAETPAVLDCFIVFDSTDRSLPSGSSSSGSSISSSVSGIGMYNNDSSFDSTTPNSSPVRRKALYMDLASTLIPLVRKPKIGPHAREALLVALSMHDRRVDSFFVDNTTLLEHVVTDLYKAFAVAAGSITTALKSGGMVQSRQKEGQHVLSSPSLSKQTVKYLNYSVMKQENNFDVFASASMKGKSTGRHLTSPSSTGATGAAATGTNTSNVAIESFIMALRFCIAIANASARSNIEAVDAVQCVVQTSFVCFYREKFLEVGIRDCIAASGELHILTCNMIVMRLLHELSTYSVDNYLLKATTKFLCPIPDSNSDTGATGYPFGYTAILRAGSAVSQQVSVSSIHCLSLFLSVAPMNDAWSLVLIENISSNSGSSDSGQRGVIPAYIASALSCKSLDGKIASICAAPVLNINTITDQVCIESLEDVDHIETATHAILKRLSGRDTTLRHSMHTTADDTFSHHCSLSKNSALLLLLKKKIQTFCVLSLEEQAALKGMVEKLVIFLCALMIADISDTSTVSSSSSVKEALFESIVDILVKLEGAWKEIYTHLVVIPAWESKLAALKYVLGTVKVVPIDDDVKINAMKYKLIANEQPQSQRVIESGIVVMEMVIDIRASLIAMRALWNETMHFANSLDSILTPQKPSLSRSNSTTPVVTEKDMFSIASYMNGITTSETIDEYDCYSDDGDDDTDASYLSPTDSIAGNLPSPLQLRDDLLANEASFLTDFAQLESMLNDLAHS